MGADSILVRLQTRTWMVPGDPMGLTGCAGPSHCRPAGQRACDDGASTDRRRARDLPKPALRVRLAPARGVGAYGRAIHRARLLVGVAGAPQERAAPRDAGRMTITTTTRCAGGRAMHRRCAIAALCTVLVGSGCGRAPAGARTTRGSTAPPSATGRTTSRGPAPCGAPGRRALEQKYLCAPNVYRGLQQVTDTRYGFRIPVPAGWWVAARDHLPPAESAQLFIWPGSVNGQTSSVAIVVCPASATDLCPQVLPLSPAATRTPATLAGVAGVLLQQPNLQCAARQPTAATATKCGYEDHEGATRGKYTYEVIGTPPVPATHPSPQFLAILRKWAWLTPSA